MNRNQNISAILPERQTVHIMDDRDRFAIIDTLTVENGTTLTTPVETMRYQYSNHLGSACLELDASANIISYEEYHPFGTTSYRAGSSEAEVSLKRYKYVGKERDEETGLYYYGARYYAGWICRFVSTDPMQNERVWVNPYNYCQNNPINRIDPTGALDDEWDVDFVTGAVTHVNTKGGTSVQTINIKDSNGIIISSNTYEGRGFDVAMLENGINIFVSDSKEHTYIGSNVLALNYSVDKMIIPNVHQNSNPNFLNANITTYSFNNYLSDINTGVGAFSLISGKEHFFVNNSSGMWRSLHNNKLYSLEWGGNQWTGSRQSSVSKANSYKGFGRMLFYVGGTISLYQGYKNYEQGNYLGAMKNGLDVGMSALGTFGGLHGFILSSIYFGMDAIGVFDPRPPVSSRPAFYQNEIQDNIYIAPTYHQQQIMSGSYNDYKKSMNIRNHFIQN